MQDHVIDAKRAGELPAQPYDHGRAHAQTAAALSADQAADRAWVDTRGLHLLQPPAHALLRARAVARAAPGDQMAFQLSLLGFCCALVINLTDAMGLALGLLLATPIVLGFVLVLVVLIANGTLQNMDVIWKPALEEIGPHRV